jgi:hypothetical protein
VVRCDGRLRHNGSFKELPVVGAAAAVSYKETRTSLAEFILTGKVKVWQASSIQ